MAGVELICTTSISKPSCRYKPFLTPTSKGTFAKARTGIAATIRSTLVGFCSCVFCASRICSIRVEDVAGRPSPATAEPFRTTLTRISRNEVKNDLATLSAIWNSFGGLVVLAFRRCPSKQFSLILRLPSRIGFSFHGVTDIRAWRAGRPPTVDKLRSPRPYFWLVRCLVLNIIDVRCVFDNVVCGLLEVAENIISRAMPPRPPAGLEAVLAHVHHAAHHLIDTGDEVSDMVKGRVWSATKRNRMVFGITA